jgi:hypothetical protein
VHRVERWAALAAVVGVAAGLAPSARTAKAAVCDAPSVVL